MSDRPWKTEAGRCGSAAQFPKTGGVGLRRQYLRLLLAVSLGILALHSPNSHLAAQEPSLEDDGGQLRLEVPESVALSVLVDLVSERLELNILYDEALEMNTVRVRAPKSLTEEGLLALLESALRFRGFTLVEGAQDGWIEVVTLAEAPGRGVPLFLPGQPREPVSGFRLITEIIPLEHGVPEQLSQFVEPFLSSPGGSLQVNAEGRLVVVTDRSANVERVRQIVALLDRAPAEVVLEPVSVENGSATTIATEVTALLERKAELEGQREGSPSSTPVFLEPQDAARRILVLGTQEDLIEVRELVAVFDLPGQAVITRVYTPRHVAAELLRRGIEELLAVQPADTRAAENLQLLVPEGRQTLILVGPQSAQDAFDRLVELLDVPQPEGAAEQQGNLRVYNLKNVPAADIATTLGELLGQMVRTIVPRTAPSRPAAEGLRLVPGAEPSQQVPPGPGGRVPGLAPPISRRENHTGELEARSGRVLAQVIGEQPREIDTAFAAEAPPAARITVESNLNALLVNATPELHEEIARLVRLLEQRPPQVMLEAIVVELSCTHDFQLGVELESVEFFSGSGVGHLIFSSFGLSMIDAVTGAKVLNPATGFNAALVRPEELPAIIQALEQETQARIVSAPRILVNDHQQAVLSRVDEEPFTSTNFRDAVTTTSFSGFAQAGTTLSIVPHISDDNHLLLEYQVQVNSFRGSAAAAGVPPARTTNLAQSSVTIPDGWAIAVGGLVGETDDFAEDRIPFLGELPLVGVAFRRTTTMKVRRTLFVFLRAHVLRDKRFLDLKHLSAVDEVEAGLPPTRPSKHPPRSHNPGPYQWQEPTPHEP